MRALATREVRQHATRWTGRRRQNMWPSSVRNLQPGAPARARHAGLYPRHGAARSRERHPLYERAALRLLPLDPHLVHQRCVRMAVGDEAMLLLLGADEIAHLEVDVR